MAKADGDPTGFASRVHSRKLSLYTTPAGYTLQRPTNWQPIDRTALMRDAHRVAKRMRASFATYREALVYGLGAAWQSAKVAQTFRSLRAQVQPRQYTAAESASSREATRRTSSSLYAA
jgi:hypothetical protein